MPPPTNNRKGTQTPSPGPRQFFKRFVSGIRVMFGRVTRQVATVVFEGDRVRTTREVAAVVFEGNRNRATRLVLTVVFEPIQDPWLEWIKRPFRYVDTYEYKPRVLTSPLVAIFIGTFVAPFPIEMISTRSPRPVDDDVRVVRQLRVPDGLFGVGFPTELLSSFRATRFDYAERTFVRTGFHSDVIPPAFPDLLLKPYHGRQHEPDTLPPFVRVFDTTIIINATPIAPSYLEFVSVFIG